jgi:protein-S-isoprenylcysteine O-methyltransferase Ste14
MVVGPGTVVGIVPYLLTRWQARDPLPGGTTARVLGAALVGVGVSVLTSAFARFAREGLGTPFPAAPPTELVVGGIYRHVRNPMYLALGSAVIGQALLLGRRRLLLYAAVMAVPASTFVLLHEEPALQATFGEQYRRYREGVPRWVPRLRPWDPGQAITRA